MAPKRIFCLLSLCLSAFVVSASAQTLVNVNDTLYNADGTKASGRIVISWDPFTAAGGTTIDGGTLTYTIPSSGVNWGVVNVSLSPNAGATPSGTSYRVTVRRQGTVLTTAGGALWASDALSYPEQPLQAAGVWVTEFEVP